MLQVVFRFVESIHSLARQNRGRRLVLPYALVLSLIMVFASCNPQQTQSRSTAELREIRVGIIPIAEVAQLYVGIERGYFEEHGIKLDLVPMAGGAKILQVLGPNGVDIGFSNVVSLALFRSRGKEFIALAGATYETPSNINHALLAGPETQLREPRDLIGKTIAINTQRNIEELMLLRFLEANDIDASAVDLRPVPFPAMPAVLAQGGVDVISTVEPFITIAKSEVGARPIANQYLAVSDRALVATYVTYQAWLDENQDLVQDFLAAFREATEFINSHPGETRRIIGEFTSIPSNLLPQIGLPEMSGEIDPDLLATMISDLETRGWIDSTIDAKNIIYK